MQANASEYPDSGQKSNDVRRGVFIYIIQFGPDAIVKVGIGRDPASRLRTLQTGAFSRLHLVQTYGPMTREAAVQIEASVHYAMESRGLHGEWFAVDPIDAACVIEGQIAYYVDLEEGNVLEDFEGSVARHFFEMRFSGEAVH